MPRFSYEEADSYGSSGGSGSFFQLKKDREKARVHILGNDMKDFPGYAVHKVQVGDKYKYINCLREAGAPIDDCPFCAVGKEDKSLSKVHIKLFIPLYNIDKDEVQVWERGKTFFRTLASYISHTPNVSKAITEIERNGKENDKETTYSLYEMRDEDDGFDMKNVEDDMPTIDGGLVLDKSFKDMEYYVDHGRFPDDEQSDDREVRRRSDTRDERRDERRTPSRRRAEDDY